MSKYQQRAVLGFTVFILADFSGCTTIDSHNRVPDWPDLKVLEHHVSNKEMRDRCVPYMGPWMSPMGCTLFFFDLGEAHIYVSKEFPSQSVLEHERLHAAGYEHAGSVSMQALLNKQKSDSAIQ